MGHYKGEVVTIYEDPITKAKTEGNARLIEKLSTVGELELWKVHFINDDENANYDRLL